MSFSAPSRGITALFGPSGCGKTTLLRCVAGLTRVDDGVFSLDGEVWQDGGAFRPPHRRPIGYVFQEASLFPHLSVRANLLYGRRRADRRSPGDDGVDVDATLDLLGLDRLLDRAPSHLSGGERQRVAIGRALLARPRLLLMDEPLSALDRPAREEILPYLERLHAALSIPVLYVSHDLGEVERLADHLVLMESGRVRAAGPLADLLADPALPLARLPDAVALLEALVESHDDAYGLTTVRLRGGQSLLVAGDLGRPGTLCRLEVPAAGVSLGHHPPVDTSILNALPARVVARRETDRHQVIVFLRLGPAGDGDPLLARISRKSWDDLGLAEGMSVHARVKAVALRDPRPH